MIFRPRLVTNEPAPRITGRSKRSTIIYRIYRRQRSAMARGTPSPSSKVMKEEVDHNWRHIASRLTRDGAMEERFAGRWIRQRTRTFPPAAYSKVSAAIERDRCGGGAGGHRVSFNPVHYSMRVRGRHMWSLICVGLVAIFSSSCMTLDNETTRADQKKSPVGKIGAFTKQMMKTMSDASADLSPILPAIGSELLVEAKVDLPNVAEELRAQITHLLPGRESRLRKARSGKE